MGRSTHEPAKRMRKPYKLQFSDSERADLHEKLGPDINKKAPPSGEAFFEVAIPESVLQHLCCEDPAY